MCEWPIKYKVSSIIFENKGMEYRITRVIMPTKYATNNNIIIMINIYTQ